MNPIHCETQTVPARAIFREGGIPVNKVIPGKFYCRDCKKIVGSKDCKE